VQSLPFRVVKVCTRHAQNFPPGIWAAQGHLLTSSKRREDAAQRKPDPTIQPSSPLLGGRTQHMQRAPAHQTSSGGECVLPLVLLRLTLKSIQAFCSLPDQHISPAACWLATQPTICGSALQPSCQPTQHCRMLVVCARVGMRPSVCS